MGFRSLALAAVLALATAACGGGRSGADIGSSATSSSTEPVTAAPSPTEPSTSAVPSTATSVAGTVRSTSSTVSVATTRRPAPSPLPVSSTAAPGAAPRCSAAQLTVEVATDKATYRPGERVQAQAILRNRSSEACLYSSYTGSQHFEGPTGQAVSPTAAYIADAFADTPLAAGAALTQSPTWDQQVCNAAGACAQAPPGTYTVKASWAFSGSPVEGSATFRLVG
jgi:hypothetical protein